MGQILKIFLLYFNEEYDKQEKKKRDKEKLYTCNSDYVIEVTNWSEVYTNKCADENPDGKRKNVTNNLE